MRTCFALPFLLLTTVSHAQQVVHVDSYITEANFIARVYNGQPFVLAPGTVFELNDGAVIAALGEGSLGEPRRVLDLGGATINVNHGARIDAEYTVPGSSTRRFGSYFGNATLNVRGGEIGNGVELLSGPAVSIEAGTVENYARFTADTVTISGGSVTRFGTSIVADTIEISGGEVYGPTLIAETITVSGGTFGGVGLFVNAGRLDLFVSEFTLDGVAADVVPDVATEIPPSPWTDLGAAFDGGCSFNLGLGWTGEGDFCPGRLIVTVTPPDDARCPCELGGDPESVDMIDLLTYLEYYWARDDRADFECRGVNISSLFAYVDCWLIASRSGPCP